MAGPAGLAFRDVVRGAERVGDAVDAQIGVPTVRTPDDAAPGDVLATAPPEDASAHALGYLHINCGPCHNPTGAAWPDTDMVLQQSVFDADSAHSAILDTTVNVELQSFRAAAGALRLVPGAADASALVERMEQRGPASITNRSQTRTTTADTTSPPPTMPTRVLLRERPRLTSLGLTKLF